MERDIGIGGHQRRSGQNEKNEMKHRNVRQQS